MLGKDLAVVAEFEGTQTLDDIDFCSIPIWVRVLKLPLGMMDRYTAEIIGDTIGQFMVVDLDDNHSDVGCFLRVKIRLDIQKPLIRGVMISVGENMKGKWCPIVYEFLPEFCYICGIIGHIDKTCSKKLAKGEEPPFDKKLRYFPQRKRMEYENNSGRGFMGRRGSFWSSSSGRSLAARSSIDAPSWRRQDRVIDELANKSVEKQQKQGQPELETNETLATREGYVKLGAKTEEDQNKLKIGEKDGSLLAESGLLNNTSIDVVSGEGNSTMQPMHGTEQSSSWTSLVHGGDDSGGGKAKRGTFKRIPREVIHTNDGQNIIHDQTKKRELEDVEMMEEVDGRKKGKTECAVTQSEAGLSRQPCKKK
ncbi:hypothetical protein QOZ80_5BG0432310 [Eleusine coracana subsp. coracana]|nr:hypothetical protein QOZ80_5BG0432310 [Eleusine coracana subsp. coracana]